MPLRAHVAHLRGGVAAPSASIARDPVPGPVAVVVEAFVLAGGAFPVLVAAQGIAVPVVVAERVLK